MSWMLALTLNVLLFMAWGLGIGFIAEKFAKEEIRQRSKWATAQGTVISSKVSHHRGHSDFESGWTPEHWIVTVKFSYVLRGLACSGRQKWTTEMGPPVQYRSGDGVAVYYNPAKPEKAVIRPDEASAEGIGCLAWATGVPVISLIIWIWSLT